MSIGGVRRTDLADDHESSSGDQDEGKAYPGDTSATPAQTPRHN